MSKYRINMNGKVYEMEVELIDENQSSQVTTHSLPEITFKGTTLSDPVVRVISPEAEKQTSFNSDTILSPMPGSVVKLMAKAGEKVMANQPIVLLEAMKMENEIGAPREGIIKEICVTEGQSVQGSVPLFIMKEED